MTNNRYAQNFASSEQRTVSVQGWGGEKEESGRIANVSAPEGTSSSCDVSVTRVWREEGLQKEQTCCDSRWIAEQ